MNYSSISTYDDIQLDQLIITVERVTRTSTLLLKHKDLCKLVNKLEY